MKLASPLSLLALTIALAAPAHALDFWKAELKGEKELPPTDTRSQGWVELRLQPDGNLLYRLHVANLQDVTMAHLHAAPAGHAGGILAWLYPSVPPEKLIPGRSSGFIAEGVITPAELRGALQGKTIADLTVLFDFGQVYANVHTTRYGAGEIRGQVERVRWPEKFIPTR
jgi:CHRD domain-containing protein